MSRDERQTRRDLIDPALEAAGWSWDANVEIGPGRVNLTGDTMYDESQRIVADYVLRLWRMPLAILEAKAEGLSASDGIQQGSRYARRLRLRFSIASNGRDYILTDNDSGDFETLAAPPSPGEVLTRLGRNIVWRDWRRVFEAPWHMDQVSRKKVRPDQKAAIFETLYRFAQGEKRVLLLMATGTGKTFTVFQLVWKLMAGDVLRRNHVLFLTDRNSLKDQAYRAFSAFDARERVTIDKEVVARGEHLVGKVFFANYQNLDEEVQGKKLYEHFDRDFFDLVVVDECHRSGFGDWFGVLRHFDGAYQLGLTATPRELDAGGGAPTPEQLRRDTFVYFTGSADGEPAFTYSLRQAIDDGYLVPYLLEERVTNVDEDGFTGPDGRRYTTGNFERDIRLPDRTRVIAEDLWQLLGKYAMRDEKAIVFCVDDTHAAFMAAELRRLSGDPEYAARITRSERNSADLERRFGGVGRAKPRVAVTVDLLTTGFDVPDVRSIVFARPVQSAILYKQMKGRGTRLCEDIDKRYFTLFDYVGAARLEDAEFDGHPANAQRPVSPTRSRKRSEREEKPVGDGVSVFISREERYVCLADGRKIPLAEYEAQSREVIRGIAPASLSDLLGLWVDKGTRRDLRAELKDRDVYVSAFRHFLGLDGTDDVDILAKVGFDLARVPRRRDRVARFWDQEDAWLAGRVGEQAAPGTPSGPKTRFWATSLDHYGLHGIDDLEQGATYSAPQFTSQFGSFSSLLLQYGGAGVLKADLEEVKRRLYVPMAA
ncbi:MAG: DEAD/DEAH box helicase family protein [Deltaproteobacteria bacterium]|nr:DEAD/DEAH box helicase family protein [Deltaproteobacteria bacterium]